MSRLEYIDYQPFHGELTDQDSIRWTKVVGETSFADLPQIYWSDGRAWDEVNVWADSLASSGNLDAQTVKANMKHLHRYADFLEASDADWRHFPVLLKEQVLRKFRGTLLESVKRGEISASTAANCMNAVIRFYRFANTHGLVGAEAPMWTDIPKVVRFHDPAGFKRTILTYSTDLAIQARRPVGLVLEGGLLPLRREHMTELLAYAAKAEAIEIYLLLSLGFFTGARIGSIISMTASSLETARADPHIPNVFLLPAGPGTDIRTKFSVKGDLMVPGALLSDLKMYMTSTKRLLREAKAVPSNKDMLFLTKGGRPYSVGTVDQLTHMLRGRTTAVGLRFMEHFKFHQTRATFGTWMMEMALDCGVKTSTAIGFVRDAMFHKDERTTWGYITFLERTKAKQEAANQFSEAFAGLKPVDWEKRVPKNQRAA